MIINWKGGQLELTPGLRKSFFQNDNWSRDNVFKKKKACYRFIDGLKKLVFFMRKYLSRNKVLM
ncbi:hypothetical protein ASE46_24220 [Bacillus sp. Root239]|nr:hypothetical protein ASE46_24220 [Bacillus sp. Root239]